MPKGYNPSQTQVAVGPDSIVPAGNVIPSSKDVFSPRQARDFDALAEAIAEAQRIKKQAEADIKECQRRLEVLFADSDSKSILSGDNRVTLVLSSNSHVDKAALLDAGVPADTIAACTKRTSFSFIRVSQERT